MEVYHLQALSASTTTPNRPGIHKFDRYGNLLQLVKFTGSTVATVRGGACGYVATSNTYTVTPDISQSSSLRPAGVPLCSLTAASTNAGTAWGWILKRGRVSDYHSQIRTDGNVVAGEGLYFAADKGWGGRMPSAASINAVAAAGASFLSDTSNQVAAAACLFNMPA